MNNYTYLYQKVVGLQSAKPVSCELLARDTQIEITSLQSHNSFFQNNIKSLTHEKIEAIKAIPNLHTQWVFLAFSRPELASRNFDLCSKLLAKVLSNYQLVIEITNYAAEYNSQVFKRNLTMLKQNGFQVAIDDYGVGNTDTESLAELKPDFVKLDISKIKDATKSEENAIKFFRLVDFIRHNGHKVVIKGIETKEDLLIAKKTRAEFGQGSLFHKPERI